MPVNTDNSIWNSLVAGSVAGVINTSIFHPFDVVRTKMQSSLAASSSSNDRGLGGKASKKAFQSPFSAFSHTIQNGGYRSLYTGLALPVSAQAVYKATVFTVNKYTRSLLLDFKRKQSPNDTTIKLSLTDSFICGTLGGAVNAFLFVSPVEFVRNQLIAQHSKLALERDDHSSKWNKGEKIKSNKAKRALSSTAHPSTSGSSIMRGPKDVIQRIVKRDGIFGLWRGTGVTVARDSIGCGFFFLSFEFGKQYLEDVTGEGTLMTSIISGSISGVVFWIAALPFDTMKTLVQNGSAKNMLSAISQIGGISNMTKGWQVALGKGAPGAAVTIGTYEFVTRLLEEKHVRL